MRAEESMSAITVGCNKVAIAVSGLAARDQSSFLLADLDVVEDGLLGVLH